MKNKRNLGDVSYYKPLSCCKKDTILVCCQTQYGQCYDVHTKTKPIAYSTKATQGWLKILHEESNSWEEMLSKANGNSGEYMEDKEAVKIIEAYMNINCPYNDMKFL